MTPWPRCSQAVNQNVLPLPGMLSQPTSPPIRSARRLVIARPRPVPPYLRVVLLSACSKSWNNLPMFSVAIPIPVSSTEKRTLSRSGFSSSNSALSTMPPLSVNLIAFPARLSKAWRTRSTSAHIHRPQPAFVQLGKTRTSPPGESFKQADSRPISSTSPTGPHHRQQGRLKYSMSVCPV